MARILIAEDDLQVADQIALTASAEGHDVLSVVNGFDAYQTALREGPDLVFLSARLSIFSGYEACEMLRNNPDIPKGLPILFLTTGDEDRRMMERAGATDALPKRHSSVELRDALVKHLGEKAGDTRGIS